MQHLAGTYYHCYNRTISGQPLFPRRENYVFLLQRVKQYLGHYRLTIIAYCLMPNHYHILARPDEDNHLSPFLQRLFNSYTQALNKQAHRKGTLFESNVKYKNVNSDPYLYQLVKYIHRNPVHANLVKDPADWEYSNYLEWIGMRNGSLSLLRSCARDPLL